MESLGQARGNKTICKEIGNGGVDSVRTWQTHKQTGNLLNYYIDVPKKNTIYSHR